ncbi:MAG: FAD-binding oxidoreductase [Chloroflexota bacterium]
MPDNLLDQFQSILPANGIDTLPGVLAGYSRDESSHPGVNPIAVLWPQDGEQVAAILKLCNQERIPVTARGGGSSLEGNAIPSPGSIVLSLERMNAVLEVYPQDFQVRVQPGVVYDELNKQLARHGLFFAPGPSSGDVATIGGMVANNAGGLNALRYGVTRDHVLRLQVALADGSLLWFGTRAMKTSSGYDLVRLIVGSEGTLGIVTEVVLRLHGLPERVTALAQFSDLDAAARAVFEVMSSGIIPGALELVDANSIGHINRYKGWTWAEVPTLIFEFHGTPAGIEEETKIAAEICAGLEAIKFEIASSPAQRDQLWAGRKEITNAEKALYPDHVMLKGDIAVPLSQYTATVRKAYSLGERYGLATAIFGHAGDGNIHWHTLVPPGDESARAAGEQASADLIRHALSVGGTATAEHGIGLAKREFLVEEHGAAVEVMKRIKQTLDPNNILNPGKMFLESS